MSDLQTAQRALSRARLVRQLALYRFEDARDDYMRVPSAELDRQAAMWLAVFLKAHTLFELARDNVRGMLGTAVERSA